MTRAWYCALLFFLSSLLLLPAGCRCNALPFAELTLAQGDVTRDFNGRLNQWQAAAPGAQFEIGEALRTARQSGAAVRFDDGAKLNLEESTTIRFLAVNPESGERGIDVEAGSAILETSGTMKLRTGIGLAVIEGGSVLHLTRKEKGVQFLVSVGLARLQGPDGSTTEVRAGEAIEVGIGMAILDRTEPEPAVAPTAVAAPPPESKLPGPIVVTVSGPGAQLMLPGSTAFRSLAEGTREVPPGSRLKLAQKSNATVTRDSQSAELSGPGSYWVGGQGADLVRPENGSALIDVVGRDLTLVVPGGTLTALGSQGRAVAQVQVKQGRFDVQVRRGKLRAELQGKVEILNAGEGLRGGPADFSISGRGLDFADLTAPAGSGLMIHDPAPPTAVGIVTRGKCPHLGLVELMRAGKVVSSAVDREQANLSFEKGTTDYQLRCLSDQGDLSAPVAGARITIYQDAGTSALAKSPPTTSVEVDGRSYTVLYQNRLPGITVRWPGAPQADSYTVSVRSAGGSKQFTTQLPVHSFQSGSLPEGTHTFKFTGSNGRVSRASSVSIQFDNAAPKASILSPGTETFGPGSTVKVSGISLPGWKVSVGGTQFPMDSQHRFSGEATAGNRGLVLRFEHEQRGVHHYLRRAAGIRR